MSTSFYRLPNRKKAIFVVLFAAIVTGSNASADDSTSDPPVAANSQNGSGNGASLHGEI